jgi:hypothetical protein
MATVESLRPGAPEVEFRARRAFVIVYALGALLLCAIGVGLVVFIAGPQATPAARPKGTGDWLALGALLAGTLGPGLAGLALLVARWPYRLRLYADGIEVRPNRRTVHWVASSEVVSVHVARVFVAVNGVPLGTVSDVRVETADGRRVKLIGRGYGFDITPLAAAAVVAGFVVFGGGAIGMTAWIAHHSGAEIGGRCRRGGSFQCRDAGFNSARCLQYVGEPGYCTRTCEASTQCTDGWTCRAIEYSGGRAERLCVQPEAR